MSGDDEPAMRQRALEREVQQHFAAVAAEILEMLAGSSPDIDLHAMERFVSLYRKAEAKSADPKGMGIRIPAFGSSSNDEHINRILRGSMRMVAVMLRELAQHPAEDVTKHEDHIAALDDIIAGSELLTKRIRR